MKKVYELIIFFFICIIFKSKGPVKLRHKTCIQHIGSNLSKGGNRQIQIEENVVQTRNM